MVRQWLLQLVAETNIVSAEGAPGLEREIEREERESLSSITTLVFHFQGFSKVFFNYRYFYIVYGFMDVTNRYAVYRTARFLALSPHHRYLTRVQLLRGTL